MDNTTTPQLEFAPLKGKRITARFDEPRVSSDGGVLYMREVDRQTGLTDRLVAAISDPRRQSHIAHQVVDHFVASYKTPPEVIVLDMDPTADHVHGHQQLAFFNAFEDEYCFMPFHVYEGLSGKYITSVLRTGKTPTASEILSVLKRIVRRIRHAWPDVVIVFRADGHHTKPGVMAWLDANGVQFVTGLGPNKKLKEMFALTIAEAEKKHQRTGRAARTYASAHYAAGTWQKPQRVICRVQVSDKGTDVRYIVTSFHEAGAKYLYEVVYCGRGKMELMIKDHKTALKSDRTSCHRKEANQFRLFVHSAAYVLMHALRENLLRGSELASAQFDTIRLRLLKIGTRVELGKTFIRFHFPASYPMQPILCRASALLTVLNTS